MYNNLKQEIFLGKTKLRNRIASSPVSINKATLKGEVTDDIISFFSNLAKNNLGMVTIGATAVSTEGGDTRNGMHIGQNIHLPGLRELSDSIKKEGAVACLQIFHVGAQGNTALSDQRVVGPSEYIVPDIGIQAEVLTIKEIKKIEEDFVKAIIQADEAGFDLIEIHMAHGYLLHQFLSPHTNKRDDSYGGSEENRMRIIKNILNDSRVEHLTYKLGARVTGDDFLKEGLNIKKIKKLIKFLDSKNFAYYSVTAGIYESAKQKYISMKRGSYWDYSKKLKEITSTPVISQGNITSLLEGEEILKQKQGDIISMAQALIADPMLVTKSFKGEEKNIYNCLAHIKLGSCHKCRYIKQKNNNFDCVTPGSWRPVSELDKKERDKDLQFWKKTVEALKENL